MAVDSASDLVGYIPHLLAAAAFVASAINGRDIKTKWFSITGGGNSSGPRLLINGYLQFKSDIDIEFDRFQHKVEKEYRAKFIEALKHAGVSDKRITYHPDLINYEGYLVETFETTIHPTVLTAIFRNGFTDPPDPNTSNHRELEEYASLLKEECRDVINRIIELSASCVRRRWAIEPVDREVYETVWLPQLLDFTQREIQKLFYRILKCRADHVHWIRRKNRLLSAELIEMEWSTFFAMEKKGR